MIPMDSIDLNSVPINQPSIEKLDTVKRKSARPQISTGSKSTAQHRLTGGMSEVRVTATALILGQMWKKLLTPTHPIFKMRGMAIQNHSDSLVHMNLQKITRSTVKNSIRLGYILYEATTSSWVTFSYELTGQDV